MLAALLLLCAPVRLTPIHCIRHIDPELKRKTAAKLASRDGSIFNPALIGRREQDIAKRCVTFLSHFLPLVKPGVFILKEDTMTTKTNEPSYQLTFDDAVQIHMMLWDGWIQSRIAAKFDVNIGRISEVKNGKLHPTSEARARELYSELV